MSSAVRTINILGVTGSVGKSAADVILSDPCRFKVNAVTAHDNAQGLAEMAVALKARKAILSHEKNYKILIASLAGTGIETQCGVEALKEVAAEKVDITLAAIIGMAGLAPLMNALRNSKVVAIANKEPLVAAGALVLAEAKKYNTQILPVDSEHNAIFQVFDRNNAASIEKIILTASGGPFLRWSLTDTAKATPAQALAHPNWSMGRKISIDSATMMNKALEVIEAHYLFSMPPKKIEVLIHPQSVVHSMVEYADGSVLAQMGASDMRTPIAHALAWPARMKTPGERLDFRKMDKLTFEMPDFDKFPALRLAYKCLEAGPYACIALNAANEVAVDGFLTNRIGFLDIMACIDHILESVAGCSLGTLEDIVKFDEDIRSRAQSWIDDQTTTRTVSVL